MNYKERILAAKYRLMRPNSLKFWADMECAEKLDVNELEDLNFKRRTDIIKHSLTNCAYYREAFRHHKTVISTEADFQSLPILTKNNIRERFSDLISLADKAFGSISTTGGSTGTPLRLLRDTRVPVDTIQWRAYKWWQISRSANWGRAWRIPNDTSMYAISEKLKWWPSRIIKLDASSLTPNNIDHFLNQLCVDRCEGLYGYVGALTELAQRASALNLTFPALKAIWSTSAPLPRIARANLESSFGAPVYDEYGSCEIMRIAVQAKATGPLIIHSDLRHVEIVDDDGHALPDGQIGNILVTDLCNKVMPLIRYQIGDRGSLIPKSERPTGLPFPCLNPVQGRTSEVFRLPNGVILPGEYLTTLFDDFPDMITGFQVKLTSEGTIEILYTSNSDESELTKICDAIVLCLKKKIDYSVPVLCKRVQALRIDRGKTRYILNEFSNA